MSCRRAPCWGELPTCLHLRTFDGGPSVFRWTLLPKAVSPVFLHSPFQSGPRQRGIPPEEVLSQPGDKWGLPPTDSKKVYLSGSIPITMTYPSEVLSWKNMSYRSVLNYIFCLAGIFRIDPVNNTPTLHKSQQGIVPSSTELKDNGKTPFPKQARSVLKTGLFDGLCDGNIRFIRPSAERRLKQGLVFRRHTPSGFVSVNDNVVKGTGAGFPWMPLKLIVHCCSFQSLARGLLLHSFRAFSNRGCSESLPHSKGFLFSGTDTLSGGLNSVTNIRCFRAARLPVPECLPVFRPAFCSPTEVEFDKLFVCPWAG